MFLATGTVITNAALDHDTEPELDVVVLACDENNCKEIHITLQIRDVDEPPLFTPNRIRINLEEELVSERVKTNKEYQSMKNKIVGTTERREIRIVRGGG